jgi:hypothetical protein
MILLLLKKLRFFNKMFTTTITTEAFGSLIQQAMFIPTLQQANTMLDLLMVINSTTNKAENTGNSQQPLAIKNGGTLMPKEISQVEMQAERHGLLIAMETSKMVTE